MTQPLLHDALCQHGILTGAAQWIELAGGRTNQVWHVQEASGRSICVKLYSIDAADNPMFPNHPDVELSAMRLLSGVGIAPKPITSLKFEGNWVNIYEYIPNTQGVDVRVSMAQTLAELHSLPIVAGFANSVVGSTEILDHAQSMITDHTYAEVIALRPTVPAAAMSKTALLHRDPVSTNFIVQSDRGILIDWQCPAFGDPSEDLSVVLSPAMQSLYGPTLWSQEDETVFLEVYAESNPNFDPSAFAALRPWYAWRLAVYCDWRVQAGAHDYLAARDAEISRLKELYDAKSDKTP